MAETMAASGVFLVIAASFVTGVISLQRNFSSTVSYANNHSAQLRISDYLARDLRESLTFAQAGSGTGLVITLTVPNYYDAAGAPRMPVIKSDGTVSYQDNAATPRNSSTIRYYIQNNRIYREVDGAARPIAENVQNFAVIPLDSTVDPNAIADFNLSGITSRVAEVKVQVNFNSRFGSKNVSQTFFNTTLMRNARTDAQTNLY